MSEKDYIPLRESEFYPWAKNLVKVTATRGLEWQIPATATQKLNASFAFYDEKYQAAISPASRTAAVVQDKNDARKTFIRDVRDYCRGYLLYNRALTNADRDMLQLPIPDRKPTPKLPPKSVPQGRIDTSVHQRHTIRVVDTIEIHPRGGRHDGVAAFETWRFVGNELPTGESCFTYGASSTVTRLVINYALADMGKIACYRFRWLNSRNQPGPWSEIIFAVIP